MARTTTTSSSYTSSGYAANPKAQSSSYTSSSYAANPNAGKTTTSSATKSTTSSSKTTSTTSAYQEAQAEKFAQKKAESAASRTTGSTGTSRSTTSAYEEAQKEKFEQKKAESAASRTTGSTGTSRSTTSDYKEAQKEKFEQKKAEAPTSRTTTPDTPQKSELIEKIGTVITPIKPSPITGPVQSIGGISLTIPQIQEIITKLRNSETRLREIWAELINNYIQQIENSWAGPDANAYIEKVRAYEPKIENIAKSLSLLADTYQKVIVSSQDTQQRVLSTINSSF